MKKKMRVTKLCFCQLYVAEQYQIIRLVQKPSRFFTWDQGTIIFLKLSLFAKEMLKFNKTALDISS